MYSLKKGDYVVIELTRKGYVFPYATICSPNGDGEFFALRFLESGHVNYYHNLEEAISDGTRPILGSILDGLDGVCRFYLVRKK